MTTDNRLSQWVEEFTSDLYSWAYYKVSDTEIAKDFVQDTFLAAAEKIKDFKGESSPKTWLFSILNHKIIDHYRKKTKSPVTIDNQFFSTFFDEDGGWKQEKRPKEWHEEEEHLLVPYSEIKDMAYRDLKEGEAVKFKIRRGLDGLEAINIRKE